MSVKGIEEQVKMDFRMRGYFRTKADLEESRLQGRITQKDYQKGIKTLEKLKAELFNV